MDAMRKQKENFRREKNTLMGSRAVQQALKALPVQPAGVTVTGCEQRASPSMETIAV